MKKLYSYLFVFSTLLYSIALHAQTNKFINSPTDIMRSNGKILVVMAVVLVIVIGLLMYIIRLDKKISQLEKNKNHYDK